MAPEDQENAGGTVDTISNVIHIASDNKAVIAKGAQVLARYRSRQELMTTTDTERAQKAFYAKTCSV